MDINTMQDSVLLKVSIEAQRSEGDRIAVCDFFDTILSY